MTNKRYVKTSDKMTKVTLTPSGVRALVRKALEDDPTAVLEWLEIHECDVDMYINCVDVRSDSKDEIILEIEEVNN